MERHARRAARSQERAAASERERIRVSGGARASTSATGRRAPSGSTGSASRCAQVLQEIADAGRRRPRTSRLGLVDFPGTGPGGGREPVNLCWKHGEDAVRFWHGLDEGYAQRKPLP